MMIVKLLKQFWLTLLLLISSINIGFCEQDPFRLGQVTNEELKMSVYQQDTSASAVVLYDYGHSSFQFTKGSQVLFKRTTRIKILKKTGLDKAEIVILYYKSKDGQEKILRYW